jgi:hypothetical protein
MPRQEADSPGQLRVVPFADATMIFLVLRLNYSGNNGL